MTDKLLILFALFLSVVFGVYFLSPKKARPYIILAFSFIFYCINSGFLTVFIVLTTCSIYFAGLLMKKKDEEFAKQKEGLEKEERKILKAKFKNKKKAILVWVVILNLLIIAILKYSGFFASVFDSIFGWFNLSTHLPVLKILLPLGISYYTLSAIGYAIDVYRGKYEAETNFLKVALFVMYFPQLVEGPFAKFDQLAPQLSQPQNFDKDRVVGGLLSVVWGVFKIYVIANRLAIIASEIFSNYSDYSGGMVIIGILAFTFQLYAEFSGVIDIARGISEMFGFSLAKNFEQPFFSKNVGEFWRRWHISLGLWFKEYVFYPVSMSKPVMAISKKLHGKSSYFATLIPAFISLFVVWFFNGLWHGASIKYVVYGLYYFAITIIGMAFEPLWAKIFNRQADSKSFKERLTNIFRVIRTFILVNFGMLIFRADSLSEAGQMTAQIFKGGLGAFSQNVIDTPELFACLIAVIIIVIADILCELKINMKEKVVKSNFFIKYFVFVLFILLILLFGAYGNGYVVVDSIYGGF